MIFSAVEALPYIFLCISILGFSNLIVNKYFNNSEGDRIVFYLILFLLSLYLFDTNSKKEEKNITIS